jgi:hypothetical protein
MTIEDVVRHVYTIYHAAKDQEYINKPLSFAVYETWKWIDKQEKPRRTKEVNA